MILIYTVCKSFVQGFSTRNGFGFKNILTRTKFILKFSVIKEKSLLTFMDNKQGAVIEINDRMFLYNRGIVSLIFDNIKPARVQFCFVRSISFFEKVTEYSHTISPSLMHLYTVFCHPIAHIVTFNGKIHPFCFGDSGNNNTDYFSVRIKHRTT